MLIAGDVYRPAAIDQLVILGEQVSNFTHQDTTHMTRLDVISVINLVWNMGIVLLLLFSFDLLKLCAHSSMYGGFQHI